MKTRYEIAAEVIGSMSYNTEQAFMECQNLLIDSRLALQQAEEKLREKDGPCMWKRSDSQDNKTIYMKSAHLQRWKLDSSGNMVTEPDGEWVEYNEAKDMYHVATRLATERAFDVCIDLANKSEIQAITSALLRDLKSQFLAEMAGEKEKDE